MINPQIYPKAPTLVRSEDWLNHTALCVDDPDIFSSDDPIDIRQAKELCQACPLIEKCLAYYLAHPDRYVVAGGMTPRERGKVPQEYRDRQTRTPCIDCGVLCLKESTRCRQCHNVIRREQLIARNAARRIELTAQATVLAAEGLTEAEISTRLGVTRRTVRGYLRPETGQVHPESGRLSLTLSA